MQKQYDVVVIGAGSGGLTTAVGFTKVGKTVLLVEKEHMGGECTNSGCIPSKALLHHAKTYHKALQIADGGAKSNAFRAAAFSYVRDTINAILEEETPEAFEKLGIDVVLGEAEFVSKCAIKVGDVEYGYKKAVIATGSQPRQIEIVGLSESDTLTNQNLFELERAPERLLVIGSGPIGLEMSQAMAMLGSQVTIATIDAEFGRLEDRAIRPKLKVACESLGIAIHERAFINRVEGKEAIFDIKDGDTVVDELRVSFDKVLVAVGRVPNFPPGLTAAGIKFDSRCIMVDSQHRTSNKYVYAVGDVAQRLKFTHTADDTARQVVTHVVSKGLIRLNKKKAVPKVTYTAPEVAQVGLSWEEALLNYGEPSLMRIEVPFTHNDRAKTDQATDGLLVVIARRLNGAVLGAHIIGPAAGELITTFTLAIDHKISMWKLQRLIFAYPTYSLIIKKAGDAFVGQQVASVKSDIIGLLTRNAPKLIAGFFWATIIISFQYYRVSTGQSYQDILFSLLDFFMSTVWGPILYMVLYAVRPLILFPATLMTALSGALFGPFLGILYTVIGENASANFAYSIGRFFGKDLRLENTVIGNWVEKLRNNTFGAVLFMRLAYFPFDLTNYASGVVGAKWRQYFMATLIGIMPGLTVFVLFGASFQDNLAELKEKGFNFESVDTNLLWISVGIFIVSLFLSKFLKRWKAAE